MIFGHLRTGTNYDKRQKIVGGKNGFGFKLVLLMHCGVKLKQWTTLEKKYTQRFEDIWKKSASLK